MAGKLTPLWTGCLLTAAVLANSAAQTPTEPPPPGASPPPRHPGWFGGSGGEGHRPKGGAEEYEKFHNVRKAIEALTPEQRKRFQENFQRWSNLSPEEKKALSDRDAFRRRKIAEDIDAALKEAGLDLDPTRRELFAKRYAEERHRIEDQLRKDMDEKRRPLLKEVIAKLKAEFATGTEAAGSPDRQPDAGAPPAPVTPPKP